MGMLIHHTWLEEQKKAKAKPVTGKRDEDPVKENEEPEAEPVKKTGSRRKTIK